MMFVPDNFERNPRFAPRSSYWVEFLKKSMSTVVHRLEIRLQMTCQQINMVPFSVIVWERVCFAIKPSQTN